MGSKILITDGTARAALAAARSLVAAGYEVYVAAKHNWSLAGVSRSVRRCLLTTDAFVDPSGYVGEVGRIVTERGIGVVMPMTDATVEAILEYRHLLPLGVVLPLPDLATYRRGSDKLQVLELARSVGFAVPETMVLAHQGQDGTWPDQLFPAVVKPHRSVVSFGGRRLHIRPKFVSDAAACNRVLAALPPTAFPVMLQRRVSGTGDGFFALRWEGRTVAYFAHRRLREKPPSGGESTYRESIAPDPELVDAGRRLLDALDWNGVAMIECKRDPVSGRYVIMEVNGRFWGSLQLAIDAGVDFPTLLVRCALGDVPSPRNGYRIGVRSRWLWGDVDHLYMRLTHSAVQLQLAENSTERLRAVIQFLTFRPGRDRCEVWRWRDPAPFLLETAHRFGLVR